MYSGHAVEYFYSNSLSKGVWTSEAEFESMYSGHAVEYFYSNSLSKGVWTSEAEFESMYSNVALFCAQGLSHVERLGGFMNFEVSIFSNSTPFNIIRA